MSQPAKKPERNLADDIRRLRADLDAYISEHVAALKVSHPNQPEASLRMDLMKWRTCECDIAAEILAKK